MEKKTERRGLGRGLSALMADVNMDNDSGATERPRRPDMLLPVPMLLCSVTRKSRWALADLLMHGPADCFSMWLTLTDTTCRTKT